MTIYQLCSYQLCSLTSRHNKTMNEHYTKEEVVKFMHGGLVEKCKYFNKKVGCHGSICTISYLSWEDVGIILKRMRKETANSVLWYILKSGVWNYEDVRDIIEKDNKGFKIE